MTKLKHGDLKNQIESNIKVLSIKEKTKDIFNVTLSNDRVLEVPVDLVVEYRLVKDKEITDEIYEEVNNKLSDYVCYLTAVKYIGSSLKCTYQIKEYLKKKKYNDIIINNSIDLLVKNGIINDELFKKEYVSYLLKNGYGRNMVDYKLKSLKLDTNYDINLDEYFDISYSLAERKFKSFKSPMNNEILIKVKKYLYQRGYSYQDIDIIVRRLKNE